MKAIHPILAATGILFTAGPVLDADVSPPAIPDSVDWVLHLDAETLRESRAGSAFLRELRNIDFTQGKMADIPFDPILIMNGLRGLTVFGPMPNFEGGEDAVDGVVVLQGTPELIQIFKGFVAGMQLETPEMLQEIEGGSDTILALDGGEVYGSILGEEAVAIGKSLPGLEAFLATHQGNDEALDLSASFPAYKPGPSGFFLGAFVGDLEGLEGLPAQARILQMTEAVSVQLGEFDDDLNLLASLSTADEPTGKQVYEVLQGIRAMLFLTQNGQPDVAALLQSTTVEQDGQTVSVNVGYPVDKAEDWAAVLADMVASAMAEEEPEPEPESEPEAETDPVVEG